MKKKAIFSIIIVGAVLIIIGLFLFFWRIWVFPIISPVKVLGAEASLAITDVSYASDQLQVAGRFRIPDFEKNVDNFMKAEGDLISGCSKRLYWVGPTSLTIANDGARFRTKIRYEQWLCALVKTRLLRDTKRIDGSFGSLNLNAQGDFSVGFSVENIRSFPDFIEDKILNLGKERVLNLGSIPQDIKYRWWFFEKCAKVKKPMLTSSSYEKAEENFIVNFKFSSELDEC